MPFQLKSSTEDAITLIYADNQVLHFTHTNRLTWADTYAAAGLCQLTYLDGGLIEKILLHKSFEPYDQEITSYFLDIDAKIPHSPFRRPYRSPIKFPEAFAVEVVDALDAQAFYYADDRQVIVAFRGTDFWSSKDWETNLFAHQVARPPFLGHVHEGFYTAMEALATKMEASVLALLKTGRDLTVTGHSLGGAMATLFAARLRKQSGARTRCFTFGSPRVGDRTFADYYQRLGIPTFRIVRGYDVVPLLPPITANTRIPITQIKNVPAFGPLGKAMGYFMISADIDDTPYTHVGHCIHLGREGKGFTHAFLPSESQQAPSDLSPKLLFAKNGFVLGKDLVHFIASIPGAAHHRMGEYLDALEGVLVQKIQMGAKLNPTSAQAYEALAKDAEAKIVALTAELEHLRELSGPGATVERNDPLAFSSAPSDATATQHESQKVDDLLRARLRTLAQEIAVQQALIKECRKNAKDARSEAGSTKTLNEIAAGWHPKDLEAACENYLERRGIA